MQDSVQCEYLIVSDNDRRFGLWVNTVGYQDIPPDSPYPLRSHPQSHFFSVKNGRTLHEYQLVYITRGRGLFASSSTPERPVAHGQLIILCPEQWHTYRPLPQTGWTEYYIGFEGPLMDAAVRNGFLLPEQEVYEIGVNESLTSLFASALEVARAAKIGSQQHLAGIALHIVGQALSMSKNQMFEISDSDQKIEQAKIFMDEHVTETLDFQELAKQLNVSYSWFRRMFKDYTGYAPIQYFQELKVRRAKQLLCSTLPIKEIAMMLGYPTSEYFSATFKRLTGLTPRAYRAANLSPTSL